MLKNLLISALACFSLMYFPASAENMDTSSNHTVQSSKAMLIHINSATVKELQTLKGVGAAKAEAIVRYRTSNGEFNSVDELLKIRGIGEAILRDNQGLLSL